MVAFEELYNLKLRKRRKRNQNITNQRYACSWIAIHTAGIRDPLVLRTYASFTQTCGKSALYSAARSRRCGPRQLACGAQRVRAAAAPPAARAAARSRRCGSRQLAWGLILNHPPDQMLNFPRVKSIRLLRGCRIGRGTDRVSSVGTSRPIARILPNVVSDRSSVLFGVDIRVQRKILSGMDSLHP